jgi:hypothetical protein
MRRIFGPKTKEVTEQQRKLHNGELNNASQKKVDHMKEDEMGRTCR